MKFGPKRGSVLYIFNNFFKDFGVLIIALVVGAFRGDIFSVLTDNIVVLVVAVIVPVIRLYSYLFTIYEVCDNKLIIRKGLLNRRVTEVPISTITTIDLTQNILCRIAMCYIVKVDNVSNMARGNEHSKIDMIFNENDALLLKSLLESKEDVVNGTNLASQGIGANTHADVNTEAETDDTGKSSFRVPDRQILFKGLLETKALFFAEGVGVILMVVGYMYDKIIDKVIWQLVGLSFYFGLLFIAIFIAIAMCIGAITSIVKYADFTVQNHAKSIKLQYGFFTKKTYTLDKERISGFSYNQTWLMRLLKVGTLEVFAIGFGDDAGDKDERAIIHPLIAEAELMPFITNFMDEFNVNCEIHKTDKGAFRYFFYRISFVLTIIFFIACIIASSLWIPWLWLIGAIVLCFCIAGRIMEYRNAGAGGNKDNIQIMSGGLTTHHTFIKTNNVESITDKGSVWKRRNGYANIHVDFLGPVSSTSVEVCNLSSECSELLKDLLTY